MLKILWMLLAMSVLQAAPYVPKSDQTVLLKIDPKQRMLQQQFASPTQDEATALKQVESLLNEANQPGNSSYYQIAQNILSPHVNTTNNTELMYFWALIKQHQHQFKEALNQLEKIFLINKHHVAARLMASRIHLIQRQTKQAQYHCKQLLGHTDIITANICLLETNSYGDDLAQSYQKLQVLTVRNTPPKSHQLWLTLMLADMAERQNKLDDALMWLNKYPDLSNVSFLTAWADLQLKRQQPKQVLQQLQKVVANQAIISDALILRLALAEKALNSDEPTRPWLLAMQQRIKLRTLRQDQSHANEVAKYYLYLNPNPKQALHWARINWQQSKEFHDEEILQAAELMSVDMGDVR